jgi:hypothetical protein
MDANTLSRFWSKVDKNGPVLVPALGPCWVWTASRFRTGYGQFRLGPRIQLAHRVAWLLTNGAWPRECALHRCDGGALGCVRPDHLFDGSRRTRT